MPTPFFIVPRSQERFVFLTPRAPRKGFSSPGLGNRAGASGAAPGAPALSPGAPGPPQGLFAPGPGQLGWGPPQFSHNQNRLVGVSSPGLGKRAGAPAHRVKKVGGWVVGSVWVQIHRFSRGFGRTTNPPTGPGSSYPPSQIPVQGNSKYKFEWN